MSLVSILQQVLSDFSNREIVLGTLILVPLFTSLWFKRARKSLGQIIKQLCDPLFLNIIGGAAVYVALIVYFLYRLDLWGIHLLKDTTLWFLFVGLITGFTTIANYEGQSLFKKYIKTYLGAWIVVEFITAQYTFSLWVEFLLVPLLIVFLLLEIVSRNRPEQKVVHQVLVVLVAILSFAIVGHSLWLAIEDYKTLGSVATMQSFLFEPILSLLYTPYLYVLVIVVVFDKTTIHLKNTFLTEKSPELIAYAKRRILISMALKPRTMWKFQKKHSRDLMRVGSRSEVDALIDEFEHPATT